MFLLSGLWIKLVDKLRVSLPNIQFYRNNFLMLNKSGYVFLTLFYVPSKIIAKSEVNVSVKLSFVKVVFVVQAIECIM